MTVTAQSARVAIGAAMKAARGRVTQDELAPQLDVDQATISRWETGKQEPSLDEIARFEAAVGKPRGYLLISAGYVADVASVIQAVAADEALNARWKTYLLESYEVARRASAEQR